MAAYRSPVDSGVAMPEGGYQMVTHGSTKDVSRTSPPDPPAAAIIQELTDPITNPIHPPSQLQPEVVNTGELVHMLVPVRYCGVEELLVMAYKAHGLVPAEAGEIPVRLAVVDAGPETSAKFPGIVPFILFRFRVWMVRICEAYTESLPFIYLMWV